LTWLSDLRRIDISAAPPEPPCGTAHATDPGQRQDPAEAVAGIVASFRFDTVLAAVNAARGGILIGAHLTLQLARHVLMIAMLLRDRDAGTDHTAMAAADGTSGQPGSPTPPPRTT
jgi:hypothetical protein